jgi:hypothetical protein
MSITFGPVPNFASLPLDEASNILYNQLVPACEARNILLSQYGNHTGLGSLITPIEYTWRKVSRALFDVGRVQRAFAYVSIHFQPAGQYKLGSYGLKHAVEDAQGEYLTNGDLIAAMLVSGFTARFAVHGSPQVNLRFKARPIQLRDFVVEETIPRTPPQLDPGVPN